MKVFEIVNDDCQSKKYLAESWQSLTEGQKTTLYSFEKEFWPLMESLVSLFEQRLSADEVEKLFAAAEELSKDKLTKGGQAAKGVKDAAKLGADTIKQIRQKLDELGQKLQDTEPVKNFDAKVEQIKQDIKDKLGNDSRIISQLEKYSDYAKENPGKTAFVIGVLTAAAAFAAGPAGGAAVGFLLRTANEVAKGNKASSAVAKAAKTAAIGALAGMAFDAIGSDVVDNIQAADAEAIDSMRQSFEDANLTQAMDDLDPEFSQLVDNELDGARRIRLRGSINTFQYNYDVILTQENLEQYRAFEADLKAANTFSDEWVKKTAEFHDFMEGVQSDPIQNTYREAIAAVNAAESSGELTAEQLNQINAEHDQLENKIKALRAADSAIDAAAQAAAQEASAAASKSTKASPVEAEPSADQTEESVQENLKDKIKGAASNLKKQATQAVTKQKLTRAWEKQGKPVDYGSIMKIMQSAGLSTDEINNIAQSADVDLPTKSKNAKQVSPGETVTASDGNTYEWKGAQWVDTSTGRVAKKDVAAKLSQHVKKGASAEPEVSQKLQRIAQAIKQAGAQEQIKRLLQS